MKRLIRRSPVAAALIVVAVALSEADAQGPFSWQLSPFCNVLTLTASQGGDVFDLSGSDNSCGIGSRSGAFGTAFVNPDGLITMSLTVLTSTSVPRHITVQLNVNTLSGPWTDSSGNTGTFVFNPVNPTGSPLPTPTLPPGPPGPLGPPGPQGPPGPAFLRVLDANGRQVGDVIGVQVMLVQVVLQANGSPFALFVSRDAFMSIGQVVFTSNDCSGPAMVGGTFAAGIFPTAVVRSDGTVLVADVSTGPASGTVNSVLNPDGTCSPGIPFGSPVPYPALPPVDLSAQFTPPFRVVRDAPN
jgi:hypothetical protein